MSVRKSARRPARLVLDIPKAIEVTAEDIKNGEIGDTSYCPIAIALRRVFPDASDVDVSDESPTVTIPVQINLKGQKKPIVSDVVIELELGGEAMDFIQDFDNEETVKPTSFRVRDALVRKEF